MRTNQMFCEPNWETIQDTLLFFPDRMEPDASYGLWFCENVLEVDALAHNGIALESEKNWDDVIPFASFFSMFRYVFVAIADQKTCGEVGQALVQRLPGIPVLTASPNAFRGCKNIREFGAKYGKDQILSLLSGAVELTCPGLLNLKDVQRPKHVSGILSGIKELDQAIGGFSPGELTVWTGRRGEGKSTILGQVMLQSLEQGGKVCAYSGELPAWRFKEWVSLQAAGPDYVERKVYQDSGRIYYTVPENIQSYIDEWWDKRFFCFDINQRSAHDEDNILKLFDYAARRYGCKSFLVDNIMTARFRNSEDYFRAQSGFVGRLVEFAKRTNTHVHLVAHPRKADAKTALSAEDVGGIGDVTNRADNVFSILKLSQEDANKKGYDARLDVLKNRAYGSRSKIGLVFDESCRRFSGRSGNALNFSFGWAPRQIEVMPNDTEVPF